MSKKLPAISKHFTTVSQGGCARLFCLISEAPADTSPASGVYINGDYSTYRGFDNETHDLPPYVTRKGSELYSIRAFHQMHCVVSFSCGSEMPPGR